MNTFPPIFLRGGHTQYRIQASFKILSVARCLLEGKWKKTISLTRYMAFFQNRKNLPNTLNFRKKQKKETNRKLGQGIWNCLLFSAERGQGASVMASKGPALRERLEKFFEKGAQKKAGYEMVITPHIGQKRAFMLPLVINEKYGGRQASTDPRHQKKHEGSCLKPWLPASLLKFTIPSILATGSYQKRYAEFDTCLPLWTKWRITWLTRVSCASPQEWRHIFFVLRTKLAEEFKNVIWPYPYYVLGFWVFGNFTAQVSVGILEAWKIHWIVENPGEKAENAIIKRQKKKASILL